MEAYPPGTPTMTVGYLQQVAAALGELGPWPGGTVEPRWQPLGVRLGQGGGFTSLVADAATGYLYFGDLTSGYVGRALLAGGGLEREWIEATEAHTAPWKFAPLAVAVSSSHIYFANGDYIGRATLAGGSVEREWVKVGHAVSGLACAGEHVYFNLSTNAIGSVNVSGAELNESLIAAKGTEAAGVATDGTYLYFAYEGTASGAEVWVLARALLTGGEVTTLMDSPYPVSAPFTGEQAGHGLVFFSSPLGVGAARSDGSEAQQQLLPRRAEAGAAAAYADEYPYWLAPPYVGRCALG